jgi:predicted membrane protein
MQRSEIVIGTVILGVGLLLFLGVIFNIDIWGLICPAGLIALGIWLIYRTRRDPGERDLNIRFVGDIRREGVWESTSDETWGFVLESRLDFTDAILPEGETVFRIGAFVNNIKATFPADIGVAVFSVAFMTDSRIGGNKQETFFIPFEWESANYRTAIKKVVFKPTCFVSEIKIEQKEIGD